MLDQVFGGLARSCSRTCCPAICLRGKRLLAYVGAHFDYIASHPLYPRIVQGEMMRAGRGEAPQLERIVRQYFRPLFGKVAQVIEEGQAAGEFRPVDPVHFVPSMIAVIVFYFINAPVMRMVSGDRSLCSGAYCRPAGRGAGLHFGRSVPPRGRTPKENEIERAQQISDYSRDHPDRGHGVLPGFDAALQRSGADRHRGFQPDHHQPADSRTDCQAAGGRRHASQAGRPDRAYSIPRNWKPKPGPPPP